MKTINVLPVYNTTSIKELNQQAKERNDRELDKFCDTCKIYTGMIIICCIIIYIIILIIIISMDGFEPQ